MTTKTKAQKPTQPEQPFHYYASTCFGRGTGDTLFEALKRANQSTPTGVIARMVEQHDGLNVHTCKVHVPRSAKYEINWHMPQGVEVSEISTHRVINAKSDFITIASPQSLPGRLANIKVEAEELGWAVDYRGPGEPPLVTVPRLLGEYRQLTDRMLGMLTALHDNSGWDELGDTLEDVQETARELGEEGQP